MYNTGSLSCHGGSTKTNSNTIGTCTDNNCASTGAANGMSTTANGPTIKTLTGANPSTTKQQSSAPHRNNDNMNGSDAKTPSSSSGAVTKTDVSTGSGRRPPPMSADNANDLVGSPLGDKTNLELVQAPTKSGAPTFASQGTSGSDFKNISASIDGGSSGSANSPPSSSNPGTGGRRSTGGASASTEPPFSSGSNKHCNDEHGNNERRLINSPVSGSTGASGTNSSKKCRPGSPGDATASEVPQPSLSRVWLEPVYVPTVGAGFQVGVCAQRRRPRRRRLLSTGGFLVPKMSGSTQNATAVTTDGIELAIMCFQTFFDPSTRSDVPDEMLLVHVQKMRQMTQAEEDNPLVLQLLIDKDVLNYLTQILRATLNGPILTEASWTITNIAAKHNDCVIVSGAVQCFIKLLKHEDPTVQERAIWGIVIVAGDRNEYRDWLLRQDGLVPEIVGTLNHPANRSVMLEMAWAAANLLRGDISAEKKIALQQLAMPITNLLVQGIGQSVPAKELIDFMECFENITSKAGEEAVALVTKLQVKMADHSVSMLDVTTALVLSFERYPQEYALLDCALTSLVNIAAGTEMQKQLVIDAGFLQKAHRLLVNMCTGGTRNKEERNICAKILCCLSNIAAGTEQQFNSFFRLFSLQPSQDSTMARGTGSGGEGVLVQLPSDDMLNTTTAVVPSLQSGTASFGTAEWPANAINQPQGQPGTQMVAQPNQLPLNDELAIWHARKAACDSQADMHKAEAQKIAVDALSKIALAKFGLHSALPYHGFHAPPALPSHHPPTLYYGLQQQPGHPALPHHGSSEFARSMLQGLPYHHSASNQHPQTHSNHQQSSLVFRSSPGGHVLAPLTHADYLEHPSGPNEHPSGP